MIIKQELVGKIKEHFDLNIYETKVWLALLSKGVVSAGETAELSGVPRSRTYDVLESLAKRGFAIVKVGKPVKYIAVEPKTVLDKMQLTTLAKAQEKVKSLSNLKNAQEYSELVQLHKTGISPVRLEDLSGHIKGRSNILSKIKEVFNRAEKEIAICTTVEDFENKSRVLLPTLNKIDTEKIKLKIALSGESHKIKRISLKNGIKVREVEHQGRFFIADKNEILFMINKDISDEEVGVWINSPYFASSFTRMFEKHIRN